MGEEEIGADSSSHIRRQKLETTVIPPPRPTASPQATPLTSPSPNGSYKLGSKAPQRLVQRRYDLDSVRRRSRRQTGNKDRPFVIQHRSRSLSEDKGIVKGSKFKQRRGSLTETESFQCDDRVLPLAPEVDSRPRGDIVAPEAKDKDSQQCIVAVTPNLRDTESVSRRESVPPTATVVPKPSEERPTVEIASNSVATKPLQSAGAREASPGTHSHPVTPPECPETTGKWVRESQLKRETPRPAQTPSPPARRRANGRLKTLPTPRWWIGGRVQ